MTENFEHPGDASLELSWVKVWLQFGPQALEPSDEDVAQSVSQILDRLGEVDENDSAHRAELLKQFQNMVVTVEDFEEFCKTGFDADRARIADEEPQQVNIPASEMLDDGEETAASEVDLTPESLREEPQNISFLETIRQEIEKAALEYEGDRDDLFLDSTVGDVLEAVRLKAVDGNELVVVEHDDAHVNLYFLCLADDEQQNIYIAHVDGTTGDASAGEDFDDFLQEYLEDLPVRGAKSASEGAFMARGPVTYLGEELVLDPDYRAVALVEMSATDLLWASRDAGLREPMSTIPESDGWTYVISSAQTVLDLLGFLKRPAVVAQTADTFYQLAFVMPGSQEDAPPAEDSSEGDWEDYISHILGDAEDSGTSGAAVSLVWGAQKEILMHLPQGCDAQDMLWELPGLLPEPLVGVQKNDEVDNLTWIYGLDEGESRRLRQYVEDTDREIGMESVLQLLGVSADLMGLADGSKDPRDFLGLRSWQPDMPLKDAVTESMMIYPNGTDPVSQVHRAFYGNPWLFVAEGAVNLGVSGLLVARARRQLLRGQSARTAGSAAAVMAALGVFDLAVSLAYSKQKKQTYGALVPDDVLEKDNSWFQQLKADVEAEKKKEAGIVHTSETPVHVNGVPKHVELEPVEEPDDVATEPESLKGKAEKATDKAKEAAKKFLRKFF